MLLSGVGVPVSRKLIRFNLGGGDGGPIGDNAPTAYDKTFTGLDLSQAQALTLTPTTVESQYVDLLVNDSFSGTENFQLHPLDYLSFPVTTNVAFTVPIPYGICTNVNQLRILSGTTEQASTVEVLGYWRDGQSQSLPRSAYIRSVLVRMNVSFTSSTPKNYKVDFTAPRQSEAELTFNIATVRDTIDNSSFFSDEYDVSENIWEPNAVAIFSTDWLTACCFKTRVRAFDGTDPQWDNLEGNYQNAGYTYPTNGGGTYAGDPVALSKAEHFAKSQVNDVRPHVTSANLIDYETAYAPWLYDRAGTLWLAYIRTGKIEWWRHAHRASQFYKNHINASTGYFDLRADDVKYSYGQSMMVDYLMTGDQTLLAQIEATAIPSYVDSGNYTSAYTYVEFTGANSIPGWTERHAAYAMLAQLNAYEVTGTTGYLTRAKEIFDDLFDLQQNPALYVGSWVKDGGLPHTIMAHEGGTGGGSGNDPVTSPWMSAILLDSIMHYYIITEDANALTFMADFGDYYASVCAYTATTGEINGYTVPWYLASDAGGGFTYSDSGDLADMEHVPDVLGGMAKCLWAKTLKGESTTALQATFDLLYSTLHDIDWASRSTNGVIGYWIRDGQDTVDDGKTLFRLAPPRKGSWWYNSASDLTYLEQVVNG